MGQIKGLSDICYILSAVVSSCTHTMSLAVSQLPLKTKGTHMIFMNVRQPLVKDQPSDL